MTKYIEANDIEIAYVSHGDPKNPTVLLIMGLAGQLSMWPDDLISAIVEAGYHVVAFDNRDIGLSTKERDTIAPNLLRVSVLSRLGLKPRVPYDLNMMAADTHALMTALSLEPVHLIGISMGGMIAQILAAKHPDSVQSLTCLMTTTNAPHLPNASLKLQFQMSKLGKSPNGREGAIRHKLAMLDMIGTPSSDVWSSDAVERVSRSHDRNHYPVGPKRQMAAIIATGDISRFTRSIKAPTLVLHGDADPLVPIQGGQHIAELIPNARFEILRGMGHDMPESYRDLLISYIIRHLEESTGNHSN